ncbi:hypothetical protein AYO20_11181 [Fonsecaea nubica]|uniref:Uncharacterized protein n=1 Tax=Fonsecaea nubica TaxID=856822 RepID=A0A178BZV6_9EURO|nr:hypothetical protein AYO20_11181 [Fonsecaea nubica]OAL22395.1 hypothetical protein AYO20_11181 [Fonsecaea nubica]
MSSRYDDRDYRGGEPRRRERDRERDPRERVEPTARERRIIDDHHPERRERDTPMSDVMDIGIDRRMEVRPDPRMERMDIARDPTRANTARSIDPIRSERTVDSRSVEPPERMYTDPATGISTMYRQVPQSRYPREDRDYLDPVPPSRRIPMDATMRDEPSRPQLQLSEFWCPGEGIEREVIQHEICKFLGQDATCRPGVDNRVCYLKNRLFHEHIAHLRRYELRLPFVPSLTRESHTDRTTARRWSRASAMNLRDGYAKKIEGDDRVKPEVWAVRHLQQSSLRLGQVPMPTWQIRKKGPKTAGASHNLEIWTLTRMIIVRPSGIVNPVSVSVNVSVTWNLLAQWPLAVSQSLLAILRNLDILNMPFLLNRQDTLRANRHTTE